QIRVRHRLGQREARAGARRSEEPHGGDARRGHRGRGRGADGRAYGSAGERCMAVSVAVPVSERTADELIEAMTPRIRKLKIAPSTDNASEMGPLVTREHRDKVKGYVDLGVKEGASLVVDGRGFKV